ncbi:integrase, partial [Burkholderia sp. Ac-20379]|nr:integrase [Burkholderia sp. Ac-20379]
MTSRPPPTASHPASSLESSASSAFPDADELAMLRAWYEGMSVRGAAERYLGDRLGEGRSARGVLGAIRRRLV